jgi:hypothetical protein
MDALKVLCIIMFLAASLIQATCRHSADTGFIPAPVEFMPPPDNTRAVLQYLDSSKAQLEQYAAEIRKANRQQTIRNAPLTPMGIISPETTQTDTCK